MVSGADRNIVGPLLLTFQHNGLLFLNCADIQGLQNTARRNSLSPGDEGGGSVWDVVHCRSGKLRGYGAWRPSWSAMDRSRVPNSTATYSLTILGKGEQTTQGNHDHERGKKKKTTMTTTRENESSAKGTTNEDEEKDDQER